MRKFAISFVMAAFMACLLAWFYGWLTAAIVMGGLIIHESGHLIALVRNRVPIAGMYFIPFVGAVIVPSERLKDRWIGVKVTLGGPALGACSALLMFGAWYLWRDPKIAGAAFFFTAINAFNMIPVFPLDGGQALAYAFDDGRKPYQAAYRRMWGLYFLGIGVIMLVMRSWFMGALVGYYAYGAIKEHLKELARREDRLHVRAALAATFGVPSDRVIDAVEAPLIRLSAGENPEFPEKLLDEYSRLREAEGLRRLEWLLPEDAPVSDEDAERWGEALDALIKRTAELSYCSAVLSKALDAVQPHRTTPFWTGRVTRASDLDPHIPFAPSEYLRKLVPELLGDDDRVSDLRRYLSSAEEPGPIAAPQALRGRVMYAALALALGALTIATGTIAHWSLKTLF